LLTITLVLSMIIVLTAVIIAKKRINWAVPTCSAYSRASLLRLMVWEVLNGRGAHAIP
jgi:hypothetical protein